MRTPKPEKDRGSRLKVSRIRCAHCWHIFRVEEIVWIARHDELRGDPILGGDAYVRFRPSRFNVAGDALDARGMPCQELACPKCHLPIPHAFLEIEPLMFSLVGVTASGKSCFLAAMTWELRRRIHGLFHLAFSDLDATNNRFLNTYEETLFLHAKREDLVALAATQMQSGTYIEVSLLDQPVALASPFLFLFRPADGHPHSDKADQYGRLVCLYDNAGEHFLPGRDTTLEPGTQHLAHSKVLFFLFDPTLDPRLRERCKKISDDPQLEEERRTFRQDSVLTEAAARARRHAHLKPAEKLQKPLLVLVAKSDVWASLIDEDLTIEPFIERKSEPASLDFAKIERVSSKVRSMLIESASEFVTAAEAAFQEVLYIPVSAFGRSPEYAADGKSLGIRPKDISPRWVTVPFLYSFAKWSSGIVDGKS